jgi:hypothetical protein
MSLVSLELSSVQDKLELASLGVSIVECGSIDENCFSSLENPPALIALILSSISDNNDNLNTLVDINISLLEQDDSAKAD